MLLQLWWTQKRRSFRWADVFVGAYFAFLFMLVGGIVYLQLTALIVLTLEFPQVAAMRPLLVAGAVLLVLLRLFKKAFPEVSAS